ncbi:MAG TPA: cyclic beta 1-2 glucan synthetase, partial [Pirellulales bacterium]
QLPEDDRILLQSVASIVLADNWGALSDQLERRLRMDPALPLLQPTRSRKVEVDRDPAPTRRDLLFANGIGGFTQDGKEYVLQFRGGQTTPAPWCNVLANEQFGTVVSESGLGYTWFENAHEFRLTPWSNDPVCDPAGEAIYVRDEETGRFFSPTPGPARGPGKYVCRHGFGYTVWEYSEPGIYTELWTYVAVDAPCKFYLLKVRNTSDRKRNLSATGYVEWTLGPLRDQQGRHVVTEIDPQTGALFARNVFQNEFGTRVSFFQVAEPNVGRTATCDRTEFLGRNGTARAPAALSRTKLSGKAGAALDPCSALQTYIDLDEKEEREVVFILGASESTSKAQALLQRFKGVGDARRTLEKVWSHWNHWLGAVHVETPDAGLNVLANGWLVYQTLACRYWGRSGFYQSGGAFGFRDQLQDTAALVWAAPWLTREHLLRSAAHQFREGDVQHWWHPPSGRGVRTKISDDYLWLPYIVARYTRMTGDTGVLDERIPFLTARPVAQDEEAYYDQPQLAAEGDTLYEHCRRAIAYGLKFGQHGLPLMGAGDWNDGMNMVGIKGRGESVWLGFFLHDVLKQFQVIANIRGDATYANQLAEIAERLEQSIEQESWDGEWYRRAYFDSGEPLGSSQNQECQIDALPQSWSVIAGVGDPERRQQAMNKVYERLVDRDARLIRLFTPPFSKSRLEPGYIKGYLPGVRENGGQYTHSAIWTTIAYAMLGDADRAWECFQLINPVNHARTPDEVALYKVEPYVTAADVYGAPPHIGRGGWTWYTGGAGWMLQLITEHLLGLRLEGGLRLSFAPCVPLAWGVYKITYRFRSASYKITFTIKSAPTHNVAKVVVDGIDQPEKIVHLQDDGREHVVAVTLGLD